MTASERWDTALLPLLLLRLPTTHCFAPLLIVLRHFYLFRCLLPLTNCTAEKQCASQFLSIDETRSPSFPTQESLAKKLCKKILNLCRFCFKERSVVFSFWYFLFNLRNLAFLRFFILPYEKERYSKIKN